MESFQRDFLDVIFQKYSLIYGRARRREFWLYTLWQFLVAFALAILSAVFSLINPVLGTVILIVMLLFYLAILVPTVSITVRRLHDIGQTGWLMLLYAVGLGIVVLIMCCIDSQPGENKFGLNPKEENGGSISLHKNS
jgi:uncharacterized membrane protein YhaH (DUF805 family)